MDNLLAKMRRGLQTCRSGWAARGEGAGEQRQIFMREVRRIRSEQGRKLHAETGGIVRRRLFAGLKLAVETSWGDDLASMLLGAYELEVQQVLQAADVGRYDLFVDVGCANGYYAAGLARLAAGMRVVAYDISEQAQHVTRAAGERNGVGGRMVVAGRCDAAAMEACLETAARPLVMLDIEGGERELVDPVATPAYSRADLIVECHDRGCGDITEILMKRLGETHRLEVVSRAGRNAAAYPELADLPDLQSALILCEMRVKSSHWLWCRRR